MKKKDRDWPVKENLKAIKIYGKVNLTLLHCWG